MRPWTRMSPFSLFYRVLSSQHFHGSFYGTIIKLIIMTKLFIAHDTAKSTLCFPPAYFTDPVFFTAFSTLSALAHHSLPPFCVRLCARVSAIDRAQGGAQREGIRWGGVSGGERGRLAAGRQRAGRRCWAVHELRRLGSGQQQGGLLICRRSSLSRLELPWWPRVCGQPAKPKCSELDQMIHTLFHLNPCSIWGLCCSKF